MEKKRKNLKVYLAGKLTDEPIGYLHNVRNMCIVGTKLIEAGYTVFIPALDLVMFLACKNNIDKNLCRLHSMEWLKACNVVVMLPGWRESQGARDEFQQAMLQDMSVFFLDRIGEDGSGVDVLIQCLNEYCALNCDESE